MSLSPFDSFQSRFVTYLLNFPRILDPGLTFVSIQDVCYLTLLSDCNATRLISSTRLRHKMENLTKLKDESLDKTKNFYIAKFILEWYSHIPAIRRPTG